MHVTVGTLIGRADGLDVYVSAILTPVPKPESFTTIEHDALPAGARRLSLQGEAWKPRTRRDPECAGQILDLVRAVSPGLADLWDRWHHNDMRPWCAHMDLPTDTSYDARSHITCNATGYRYGQAWLYEPLPSDIVAQLGAFGIAPAGDHG